MSVALAKKETSLSIVQFDSPALASPDEVREFMDVMQANLSEDVPIEFARVKIPAGGGLAWEVPTEDGDPETVKELKGIVIDHYLANAYWASEMTGGGSPPNCSSLDAHIGIGNPGGECAKCPYNQYGSAAKGRGKACKNMRRVYLLPEGEMFPLLLTLPPTSLGAFNEYVLRLTSKQRKPIYGVVSSAKLIKAQNKDGVPYSEVHWSFAGALAPEAIAQMKAYAAALKPAMRTLKIEATEYNADDLAATRTYDVAGSYSGPPQGAVGAVDEEQPY